MKKFTLFISICFFIGANSQELLTNGDFEAGLAPWLIDGAGSVVGGEVYFSSTTDAGNPWDTQLVHGSLSFTAGTEYTLSFRARADVARDITVAIQNVGSWDDQFRQDFTLTTMMQTFEATFNAPTSNGDAQLAFMMGALGSTAGVYFDDVSLIADATTPPPTGSGPVSPIDFEATGNGADWTWTVFENGSNPAVEIIANPDPSGVNTSATVMKFTTEEGGMPWAGVESTHGADLGAFEWDANNRIVRIMVWKSVISDVGIKFASNTSWAELELKVPNTKINEWEELTFDFSNAINPPAGNGTLDQIIIFPDFIAGSSPRTEEQTGVSYVDHITFFGEPIEPVDPIGNTASHVLTELNIYPNPAQDVLNIQANGIIDGISIVNLLGQNVLSVSPNDTNSVIDVSRLRRGVYFVQASVQGVETTSKFIKK